MRGVALFLALLVGASAAPTRIQDTRFIQCQAQCPVVGRLPFQPGHTYRYDYALHSSVGILAVPAMQQKGELHLTAVVDLHVKSACEVLLQVSQPSINGQRYPELEAMTRYPLKAVMIDGVFPQVCAEENDPADVVNFKKGILSSIQNSLLSSNSSGLNIGAVKLPEVDVLGECETTYEVTRHGSSFHVEKTKDHRSCTKRVGGLTQSALSGVIIKNPYNVMESKSICIQIIQDGVIKSVECNDMNKLTIAPGMQKKLSALQTSSLRLKQASASNHMPLMQSLLESSIVFSPAIPSRDSKYNMVLSTKLYSLCENLKLKDLGMNFSTKYTDMVTAMDRVQEDQLEVLLQKIESGQLCPQARKEMLELYLNGLSSTTNPGAIKPMVQKILDGQRVYQYSWRIQNFPYVCKRSLAPVKRLFERASTIQPLIAAGSAIKRHCEIFNCEKSDEVHAIIRFVSQKLKTSCQQPGSQDNIIGLLKAIQNMKRSSLDFESALTTCLSRETSELTKTLAAETIQYMPCISREFQESIFQRVVKTAGEYSDRVKIFTIRGLIKHMERADLEQLLPIVLNNTTVNVQSAIASTIVNVLQSETPYKMELKDKLSALDLTPWLKMDRNLSQEKQRLSKFAIDGLLGSEILSDYIYNSKYETIPVEMKHKISLELFKQLFSFGEFGVRTDNLSKLVRMIVSQSPMLKESFLGGKLIAMVDNMYAGKTDPSHLDVFMKMFGQELVYLSLTEEKIHNMDIIDELRKRLIEMIEEILSKPIITYQNIYELQISTINGLPLILSQNLLAIAKINNDPVGPSTEVSPLLSVTLDYFIGYKLFAEVGIDITTKVEAKADVNMEIIKPDPTKMEVKISLPEGELVKVSAYQHAVIRIENNGRSQIIANSTRDSRTTSKFCKKPLNDLNIDVCLDYDVTDLSRPTDFPLNKPSWASVNIIMRENPKSVLMTLQKNDTLASIKLEVPNTRNPTKMYLWSEKSGVPHNELLKLNGELLNTHRVEIILGEMKENEYETLKRYANAYYKKGSNQWEQIFNSSLKTSDCVFKLDVQTLQWLKNYVKIDVGVDMSIPSYRPDAMWVLNAAHIHFKIKKYELDATVTPVQNTDLIVEYQLLATAKNDSKLLGQIVSDARLRNEDEEFMLRTRTEVKGSTQSIDHIIVFDLTKFDNVKSINFDLTKRGAAKKLVKLLLVDGSDNKTVIADLSCFKINVSFHGLLKNRVLQVEAKSAADALKIIGPFELNYNRNEIKLLSKLGVSLSRNNINTSLHIDANMDLIRDQLYNASVVVNKPNMTIAKIATETILRPSLNESHTDINIPEYIDMDVKLSSSEQAKHLSTHWKRWTLGPRRTPRTIEGEAQVSLRKESETTGIISGQLDWDKTRRDDSKLIVSSHYEYIGNIAKQASLQLVGDATFKKVQYSFDTKLSTNNQTDYQRIKYANLVNLLVKQAQDKIIELTQKIEYERSMAITADTEIMYNMHTTYNSSDRCNIDLVTKISHPAGQEIVSGSILKAELTKVGSLSLELQLQSAEQRKVFIVREKMTALKPRNQPWLRADSDTEITFAPTQRTRVMAIQTLIEVATPSSDVEVYLAAGLDAREEKKLSVKKSGSVVFSARVLQGNVLEIELPQKNTKIGLKNDERCAVFEVVDTVKRLNLFKAEYTKPSELNRSAVKFLVQLQHENRAKLVKVDVNLIEKSAVVSFDVLSASPNPMVIRINRVKDQRDAIFKMEANVDSNGKSGPKLSVAVGNILYGKYLDIEYKQNERTLPIKLLNVALTKISQQKRIVTVTATYDQREIILAGSLENVLYSRCLGYKLNSTVSYKEGTSISQKMLHVSTCNPLFIKAVYGNHDAKYVFKAGLKDYTHAEVSLIRSVAKPASSAWLALTDKQREYVDQPMLALSAKLQKLNSLQLRASYDEDVLGLELAKAKSWMVEEWAKMKSLIRSVINKLATDIKISHPEISSSIEAIAKMCREFETLLESAIKKIVEMKNSLKNQYPLIVQFHQLIEKSLRRYRQAHEYVKLLGEKFNTKVSAMLTERGYTRQYILQKIRTLVNEKLTAPELMHTCDKVTSLCEKVKPIWPLGTRQLKEDLASVYQLLEQETSIRRLEATARWTLRLMDERKYFELIQEIINLVIVEPKKVQITLPLKQLVHQVYLAPLYIGLDTKGAGVVYMLDLDTRTLSVRPDLLTRSSIVFPKSRCEYKLAVTPGDINMTYSAPGYKKQSTLNFYFEGHKVEYKQRDSKVIVDGLDIPPVPRKYREFIIFRQIKPTTSLIDITVPPRHGTFLELTYPFPMRTERPRIVEVLLDSEYEYSGIIFDFNLPQHPTVQQLAKYKVDPTCVE